MHFSSLHQLLMEVLIGAPYLSASPIIFQMLIPIKINHLLIWIPPEFVQILDCSRNYESVTAMIGGNQMFNYRKSFLLIGTRNSSHLVEVSLQIFNFNFLIISCQKLLKQCN